MATSRTKEKIDTHIPYVTTAREKRLIQKAAKAQGLTVSKFTRLSTVAAAAKYVVEAKK